MTGATLAFDEKRKAGYAEVRVEDWRDWASAVKTHTLQNLDTYLEEAEKNLIANGCEVHWAETAVEATDIVCRIAASHDARTVVKGKSMLSEEVALNSALEAAGVCVTETDLGEYIIQLLDEPPSHIVGPAIHKSLGEVQQLFAKELGTSPSGDPDELAGVARSVLRERFLQADMGISGANFLAADTGTIALIENEGNIRLTTSLPRVHVALIGIEKILPRLEDVAGFVQLTARAATGQPIGMFTSLIQGPALSPEDDGPDEVHVILVDNGRAQALASKEGWEALKCVRCGACLNTCPVYRQTGGHAYGWVYSGPIGSVLDPGLLGLEAAMPLPYASTLCGACVEVCPVRIPITEMLVRWREAAVQEGLTSRAEGLGAWAVARVATSPKVFPTAARLGAKGIAMAGNLLPVVKGWTKTRVSPKPSEKPFRQLWQEGIDREGE